MFGKAEWFRSDSSRWRLTPVVWQGKAYRIAWAGIVLVPCLALLSRGLGIEMIIWVVATASAFLWDVHQIKKRPTADEAEDLLYIGDEESEPAVATRNFRFRVR